MESDNCLIVIFGASGDLTRRKLLPAFLHLFKNSLLPEDFAILGVGRSKLTDEDFRSFIDADPSFLSHLYYSSIDTGNQDDYGILGERIHALAGAHHAGENVLYYLSTPPSLYDKIPGFLHAHGLTATENGWKRLVVEKPFGYDGASAARLDETLHQYFDEPRIFRIDHYLGKETVQNLLVFRFANGVFEPMWNRNFVDHIEITAAEHLGVEKRGGYYDGAGAVRDMFQNHLLQVLALTAMEPPAKIDAGSIRDEASKVLKSLKPLSQVDLRNNLVLGQYTGSEVRGEHLPAYRDETGVDPESRTETYVGLKLFINNWRWEGVPIYVRTGKRLPTRVTEVVVHFKSTPHPEFAGSSPKNTLIIRIQPDEGIRMNFSLKEPGAGFKTSPVSMNFYYNDLQQQDLLSAYERLLLDAIRGDATLFARSDAVHACWDFVEPILEFKEDPRSLFGYAAGTWGPREADELLSRDGRSWRFPCKNLTDTQYCEL